MEEAKFEGAIAQVAKIIRLFFEGARRLIQERLSCSKCSKVRKA